jgi:hypothetical protein
MEEPGYFRMTDAEYMVWRDGSPEESALVEAFIRDGLVRQGEQGPVLILTPAWEPAFSLLIRDAETERRFTEEQHSLGIGSTGDVTLSEHLAALTAKLDRMAHEAEDGRGYDYGME